MTTEQNPIDVFSLLDDFPLMIWKSGLDAKCNYFNRTWLSFTGRTTEQELGDGWTAGVHPDDFHGCLDSYLVAFHARQPFALEYRLRRHDGEYRWIVDWGRPISDLAGEFAGYIGAAQDITDRVRAERDLRQSEDRFRQTNLQLQAALHELTRTQEQMVRQERLRAVGQMASGIAHDLNNSLSPVISCATLIASSPDLPERLRNLVQLINLGALDAAAIVRRLNDFSRTRPGVASDVVIGLAEFLRQIPDYTSPKWRDEVQKLGRRIDFTVEVEEGMLARGDPSALREVLTNLVFNAVDAMPTGGTITLRARKAKAFAIIEVCDTGIGMTEETLRHCFEPFFTTKGFDGSGLGLSVCHGIVRRHEGRFEIESRPGAGTTMRLFWPLAEQIVPVKSPGPHAQSEPLVKRRVLYIDDDPRLRPVVATLLRELGQEVAVASGGAEGLSRFRAEHFDLVITDLGMPDVDGRDVAREVKQLRPNCPVIMVTGWGSSALDNAESSDVMPDHMLAKPLTFDELREAILRVLPP